MNGRYKIETESIPLEVTSRTNAAVEHKVEFLRSGQVVTRLW
jgi:hypothetical protein